MADPNTIVATFGVNTEPLKRGISEVQQHVERTGSSFSKLFALEPLGERRGAHAMSRLVEGLTEVNSAGAGAVRTMTSFGQSLSTGLVGGAVIGGVGLIAAKFVEANEEVVKTTASIDRLVATANKTGTFQGLEQMRSNFSESTQKVQELSEQLIRMRQTSGLGVVGRDIDAAMHGFLPTSIGGIFGGKDSASTQYGNFLYEERQKLLKTNAELVRDMAQKERETANVEEIRYRVGQRAADAAAEELKNKEISGALADAASKAGLQFTPELAVEKERHEQAQQRISEQYQAEQRERALREQQAAIGERQAQGQLKSAEIQISGLSREEKALAIARQRVTTSRDQEAAAQAELDAAQEQLRVSQSLGEEDRSRARERVSKAEAGVTGARAGTVGAAGGVGEAAGSQLEREGAEEAMSEQEKAAQYWQRIRQFEGIRHAAARKGIPSDIIEGPKYGEADYDPTSAYRSAVSRQTAGAPQQQQRPQAPASLPLPTGASTESTLGKILGAVSQGPPRAPGSGAPPPAPAPAAPTAAPAAGAQQQPPAPTPTPPPQPALPPATRRPEEAPAAPPAGAAAPPSPPLEAPRPETGGGFQSHAGEVVKHIPPELVGIAGRASPIAAIAQELFNPPELAATTLSSNEQVASFQRGISAAEAKGDTAQAERLRGDPQYAQAQRLAKQEQQEAQFKASKEGASAPATPGAASTTPGARAPAAKPPTTQREIDALADQQEQNRAASQQEQNAAAAKQKQGQGMFVKPFQIASKALSSLDKMLGGGGWDKQPEPAAGEPGGPQFPAVGQPGGPPVDYGGQMGYGKANQFGGGGGGPTGGPAGATGPLRGVAPTPESTPGHVIKGRGRAARMSIAGGETLREQLKAQDVAGREAMPGETTGQYQSRMEALRAEDAARMSPGIQNEKQGRELIDKGKISPGMLQQQGIDPGQSLQNIDFKKLQDMQANQQSYADYWKRPDVQSGVKQQNEIGRQTVADEHTGYVGDKPEQGATPGMFSHSSARDKLPSDDSGLAHQMDRPAIPFKRQKFDDWLNPAQPITAPDIPQQDQPTARAGGGGSAGPQQQGEKPLTKADLEAALAKYWA